MSVQELLMGYIAEHRAGGEADPAAYLQRAEPGERRVLAALIDAYLERTPRAAFDESAYERSPAAATVEALERSIIGVSGTWPALLPRLRARAHLKRRELVERLAQALGQTDRKEKVGLYYHQMEQGLLPPEGVSDRVLEALAILTGSTLAALREAGRAMVGGGGGGEEEMTAFARAALVDSDAAIYGGPPMQEQSVAAPTSAGDAEVWDEVDELFRGAAT